MGKTNPKLSPGWQCIWARVVAAISRHHQILSGEAKTVFVVTLWENARHFLHDFVLPGSLTVERTEHGQSQSGFQFRKQENESFGGSPYKNKNCETALTQKASFPKIDLAMFCGFGTDVEGQGAEDVRSAYCSRSLPFEARIL